MQKHIAGLIAAGFVLSYFLIPLAAEAGQVEALPEECEALAVWQSTREQRIEQEFQRRRISTPAEKQLHRAEVERVIDERIETLKGLCAQKKK